MRILYDHQVFSLQNTGGASRYHYELARSLTALSDTQIEFVLGFSSTACPFRDLSSARTRVTSLNTRCPPGLARYVINELLGNAIAIFHGKVEIYHPTLYRSMPMVRSHKIVVTHHDCVHERFPNLFPDANRVIRAKRKLFAAADAVICVSDSSRRDLLRFYKVNENKVCVIHHGLSQLRRDPATAEHFRASRLKPYVLYVGSRAAYKNFVGLLRAFARAQAKDTFDLVAVGGGPLRPAESAVARDLEIDRALHIYPAASDALLAEAYASAELFVYPSLCEGFGFPPLEAMGLGCPVLVSRCSSLPEICRDGASYFEPEDPGSLAQALAEALSLKSANAPIIARGREVAASYDWGRCGQQTCDLYRSCLAS